MTAISLAEAELQLTTKIELLFNKEFEKKILANILVTPSGCWEHTKCRNDNNYGVTRLAGKNMLSHRASYKYHYKNIPEGRHILHKCDNPPCCNPEHLFPGTDKDNMEDKVQKGRQSRKGHLGIDHGMAILAEAEVISIFTSTKSDQSLSLKYKVSKSTISMIRTRNTWTHITKDLVLVPLHLREGTSKPLTDTNVKEIYYSKELSRVLALKFDTDKSVIDKIRRKVSYRKVTDILDKEYN